MRTNLLTLGLLAAAMATGSPQGIAQTSPPPAQPAAHAREPISRLLLERHPLLPSDCQVPLTETLLANVAAELDDKPEIDQALRAWLGRDTAAPIGLIRRLKEDRAIWTLVALAAFDSNTRGAALNVLAPFGDPSIVPELAAIARCLPDVTPGDEHTSLHARDVATLRILLSRLTGVWLLDHTVPLTESVDRWLATHEANRLTDIELARRAVARLRSNRVNADALPPYYARDVEEDRARDAFVDVLYLAYAHRLEPRSRAGAAPEGISIEEGVLPVFAALDALDELMLDWNPVGWSRGHVTTILGEPDRTTEEPEFGYGSTAATYFWDTGFAGSGIRFTFTGGSDTVSAVEQVLGG